MTNDGAGNSWVTSASVNNPNYPDTGLHARYAFNAANPADTWFFSPALNLSAGTTYYLEFNYGNRGSGTYVERLEVKMGGGQTSGSMTTLLFRNNPTDNAAECINVCNRNWHHFGNLQGGHGVQSSGGPCLQAGQ